MEEFIAIHDIDKDFWEKDEEKSKIFIPGTLKNINKTNGFSFLYKKSLTYLYERVALKKSKESIKEALYLATKAIETCFLFATQRASEVRFSLAGGEEFQVKLNDKFNPANYTSDVDYINAIYLAILSNGESLNKLAEIEVEELTFANGKSNVFYGDYANMLRSVVKKDGRAGDWLTKAFKGTFPDLIKYGIPEYIEHNDVEHLKVWIALLGRDEEEFNNALKAALIKHKDYWSLSKALVRGGVIPKNDKMGLFSLPLTALCKLAHQNGVSIRIKSDYLPELLVFGK